MARSTLGGALELGRLGWRVRRARQADGPDARERAQRRVMDLIGHRRGLAAKLGQLLAAGGEDAYADANRELPPLPLAEIVAELTTAWDAPLAEVLSDLQPAAAAASFGQVHRARLVGEEGEVAIKVRYPGIAAGLDAQLKALGLVPGLGPMKRWGFDLAAYRCWLRETLDGELDYRREARTQARYRGACLQREHAVVVPRVSARHVRANILVQSWEEGVPAASAGREWSPSERRSAGEALVHHVLDLAFGAGLLHVDLHRGNVAFRREGGRALPVLYDYGCVLELTPGEIAAATALLDGLRARSAVDPAACLVGLGFDASKLRHLRTQIPAVCRLLCEPLLSERPFDPAHWRLDERMRALLGEHCWWFRSAGPPRFLLIMRAFQGLLAQLVDLDVRVDWSRIWQRIRRQLPDPQPPVALGDFPTCDHLADHLRVQVLRDGREHVDLCMPATVLEDLGGIMDADLRRRIRAQGHDIEAIGRTAIAAGYPRGELFTCSRDRDHITVSLH